MQMQDVLRITDVLADDEEVSRLMDRVACLGHLYVDGRLFVGRKGERGHEVTRAVGGQLYCACLDFKYRAHDHGGQCKHTIYTALRRLEFPRCPFSV